MFSHYDNIPLSCICFATGSPLLLIWAIQKRKERKEKEKNKDDGWPFHF